MIARDVGLRAVFAVAVVAVLGLFAPHAVAQYYPYPYLEAECPDTATGGYVTKQTSITGASGGAYLRSVGNISPPTYNNTSADHAVFQFTMKAFGYYRIWFRVHTNGSAGDDSFFYQVSPTYYPDWITVNNVSGSNWQWIPGEVFGLPQGANTIEIANREDGLNIDKIAILPYQQAGPTGTGQAAYNCPVPVYFEAECRKGAFAEYQKDKKTKTGYSGTGYLEAITGTTTSSPRIDEATYFFESGAGAYNLFFRINTNGNASNDSWFYSVDSGTWVTMNMQSGLGSGWRWAQGTGSVTLTHGKHTIQIRNREAGLSLDKLAFVPTSATGPSGTGAGSAAVNCEPFQTMSDWGPGEVAEFYDTHYQFFHHMGPEMLDEHFMWHETNGIGGREGVGSGTAFLGYHRAMMNHFRSHALETNGRSWLPISTVGRSIPQNLGDSYQALMAVDMLYAYGARTDSAVVDWGLPPYLGGTPHPNWQNSAGLDGANYFQLGDFESLDALGRVIGTSYHVPYHSRVGGTMIDPAISPTDPIFYGWHGLIDKIASNWLNTTKGQQWRAANPDHPFLKDGYTDHSNWNNTDWD